MAAEVSTTTLSGLLAARTRSGSAEVATILAPTPPGVLSLAGGFPHPGTFPSDEVAAITAQLLADEPAALQYTPSDGVPSFTAFLSERMERLDGRRPGRDELLITSGGMDSLALACLSLVEPGDVVVVEAPTYLGALMAFAAHGATIVGIPVDSDGMRVDDLARRLDAGLRPKFVYTIPEFQNPTGLTLPLERREALIETCRRHGVPILEDVAYREIAFGAAPPPSLWSLAPDVVVQAGTFSKIFAPGLRLGWAVGPAEIVGAMAAAKQTTDQCANGFGQRIIEAYGRGGGFDRRIPRSQAFYAAQWAALEAALERHLPEGCSWSRPGGGFFAWLTLPPGIDAGAIRPAALEAGVTYVPGHAFHTEPGAGTNELRLSFSYLEAADLERAVERLAGVLRDHR